MHVIFVFRAAIIPFLLGLGLGLVFILVSLVLLASVPGLPRKHLHYALIVRGRKVGEGLGAKVM